MKILLLCASAFLLGATCCTSETSRTATVEYAVPNPADSLAQLETQLDARPATQTQVIILPGYYGAAHYASDPGRYYTDPHSAYYDRRSSAYHRHYADEYHAEHRLAGTAHQNAAYARAAYPQRAAATRPVTTRPSPGSYRGFSATPSRIYTVPARAAAPAPAVHYSAPARVSAPVRTYSAPAVHTYAAPSHSYSAPHVSVSAHH